jgi:nitrogen fixation/metabolism regulation signal transduction histidine kinase
MRKRLFYWFASVLLAISVALVVWQGSFRLNTIGPSNAKQTFIFWAVSTLIFILMVTVGWILAREFIKLYVARQAKRLGSRIRTKLVVGAMMLSCMPVFFLVLWSYEVLNVNLKAWFTNPVENQVEVYKRAARALDLEIQRRLTVQATLLAGQPETQQLLSTGAIPPDTLQRFAHDQGLASVAILPPTGLPLAAWGPFPAHPKEGQIAVVRYPLKNGLIELSTRVPLDAGEQLLEIKKFSDDWAEIVGNRRDYRTLYIMLMVLITLFVLFVATWLARILANRISTPITASSRPRAKSAAAISSIALPCVPRMSSPSWSPASTR